MLIKTKGICLHTTKYGESSVIAQVFTEEKGLQSYIISGVRARQPKVHASLLQPMSMLDMVVYFRPDKTLFRTKEIRSAYTFQRIPFEIQRSSVCLFIAEVLLKVLRESEAQADLFPFIYDFALHLDTTEQSVANLPVYFLLWMTDFLGFQPERPTFGAPYYFDWTQGYFLPEVPEHDEYSGAEVSMFLVALLDSSFANVAELKVSKETRSAALNALLDYLQGQMERFRGISSHRILAEVLRN